MSHASQAHREPYSNRNIVMIPQALAIVLINSVQSVMHVATGQTDFSSHLIHTDTLTNIVEIPVPLEKVPDYATGVEA